MKFWKMHGLGNDYIIIDDRESRLDDPSKVAQMLCKRRFSVGADGLLIVNTSKQADVRMRIFNADGSEAEMCGNGIRCFAKYCYENGIVAKEEMCIETLAGVKMVWLTMKKGRIEEVKVDMGKPVFDRSKIPMVGEGRCVDEELMVDGRKLKITCLSIGNPHCVIFVDDVADYPVQELGPKIENSPLFPNRTNVEFVQIMSSKEVNVRVWERGCGETLACGTGAAASVVASSLLKKTDSSVLVHLLGGILQIEYDDRVLMTGGVEKVFEGRID